ncbi:hypothetical protein POTOM_021529 [Populus tomentosa]|uniref:FAF domain-containing protein n=1 Tax=Populus tomentosa TaxID=118781 RepID=A0A8X7ZNK2_POPTO|nr:hypothetical protein POTOM_021529 [Populus tomentosa]
MIWTSASPSPMRFPREWPAHSGLKTLLHYSRGPDQNLTHTCYILHSYMIPAPSPPSWSTSPPLVRSLTNSSSYSSCSSALDDLIGTESGVYMNANIEEETAQMEKLGSYHQQDKRKQRYATRKKYPPPLPLLARTGNLPSHMPWILTRHYIDGRLVLVEERVKNREYFEAQRENGRLVLNIVPLDDKITCSHFVSKNKEEKELQDVDFLGNTSDQEFDEEEEGGGREAYQEIEQLASDDYVGNLEDRVTVDDEVTNEKSVTASASLPKSTLKNGSKKSGDLRKCSTYAGRMISDINLPCNANAHRNAGECMNNIRDHLGKEEMGLMHLVH